MHSQSTQPESGGCLLTRAEAARTLALSVRKLDELISTGAVPAVRIGRAVRIERSAVEAFVAALRVA